MGSQELSRTTMFCFCACIITQHALTMIVLYLRTRQSMVLSVVFVATAVPYVAGVLLADFTRWGARPCSLTTASSTNLDVISRGNFGSHRGRQLDWKPTQRSDRKTRPRRRCSVGGCDCICSRMFT